MSSSEEMRAGRSRAASTRLVVSLPPLIMAASAAEAKVESATETERTNKISNQMCVSQF